MFADLDSYATPSGVDPFEVYICSPTLPFGINPIRYWQDIWENTKDPLALMGLDFSSAPGMFIRFILFSY